MDKVTRPTIGIYDERTLQRQMLHHNLERMPYEMLYSSSDLQGFIQNYLIHPVDIILYNAENGIEKVEAMLKQLPNNKRKLNILVYYGCRFAEELASLKTKYGVVLLTCKGTWEDIIISLDILNPSEQKDPAGNSVLLDPANPFYNIASNKTYVRILELLREGRNVKQISVITGIPENNISYYIKRMRQETGCSSVVELVIDAKETGVL